MDAPIAGTKTLAYSFTPVESLHIPKITVATTGTTIDLANFTTIQAILIKNTDATNYVNVDWTYEKKTKTWAVDKLTFANAGTADTIVDADSTFISALSLVKGDSIIVTGCTENTANNGTWFVAKVAAGTLTMGPDESLTSTTAGTEAGAVTIVSTRLNTQRIPPIGMLAICDKVNIAADLVLTANTAGCICEIMIIGT